MNNPSNILPYLVLGTPAVRTPQYLKDNGITLVINAANNYPPCNECCIPQVLLKCDDTKEYPLKKHFDDVALLIEKERKKGGKIFVHCVASISRSPTLIIAYLMRYKGMTLLAAYNLVKEKRWFIRPNIGFWEQLVEYEKEINGSNTVTMIRHGDELIPSV